MWLTASWSITSMGWCTYLMHWHVECWVNTFFIGLPVSPSHPCGQSLFCHAREIITPPPAFCLSPHFSPAHFLFLSQMYWQSVSLYLSCAVGILSSALCWVLVIISCSHHTSLTLGCHVYSHCLCLTLFVERWFNWLCVALSEVALMDRWLGKEALVPAKNESCQAWNCKHAHSAHCQPAAVSYSPSARAVDGLARALTFILQSWCGTWGILWSLTTLPH